MEHFEAALDVFKPEASVHLVHFFKIALGEASSVVVDAYKEFVAVGVLGEVDETGITVFEDVVDQFLEDTEDDLFLFATESFAVVVEAAAGIHGAGATDFLKKVVHRRFQPEIFEGRGHEAM